MDSFMYDNYDYFVNIKPQKFYWLYILIFIILILVAYSFTIKSGDVVETKSYYECSDICQLYTEVPLNNINELSKAYKIKIANIMVDINDYQIGDIKLDETNKSNYQLITYTIEKQDIINKTYNDVK